MTKDGEKFRAFGVLDGLVESLSVRGKASFKIFDSLLGNRVVCYIPSERLNEAKDAIHVPPRRVAVCGEIRYAKNGKPVSLQVEEVRILREQSDLPQAKDLKGIDITGGVDPTDFIRSLRDDD